MIAVRVIAVVAGAWIVLATLGSAVRTVILPRGVPARITRVVFVAMRLVFQFRARPSASYERRDRVMATYAPLSLLMVLVVWLALIAAGYTLIFWGLAGHGWVRSLELSGSSVFTLGFILPAGLQSTLLTFSEAAIGMAMLAMLITYLPSIYSAFARREALVTALEVRAGSPPSGVRMVEFFHVMGFLGSLGEFWDRWEGWFADVEESHTSFPVLVFFRSQQPHQSWVTAAGAVLDGASLLVSCVQGPREPPAEFVIRAGTLALRRICDYFSIPYPADPHHPADPITISRQEFDEAYDRLRDGGVPVRPDRERAWADYAGWRVNYDAALVELAGLAIAPYAPWSSDRGMANWRPPILLRTHRPRRVG